MEWLLSRCESLEPDEFYEIKESHSSKNGIIDNVIQIDNQNKIKKPTKNELNKLVEKFSKSSQSNALRITKKKKNALDLGKNEIEKTTNKSRKSKYLSIFLFIINKNLKLSSYMKNYIDFKRSSSLDLCTIRRSNFNFKSYNSINWVYKLQCEC